jgi:molybdate transport system permease protein
MMLSPAESEALWLSLSVAARAVLINLPFAIVIAWLLTRARFAGRTLFDAFVHLPLVLPPVVVGYLLLVLFGVRGPIGGWLHQNFGIQLAFTSTGAAIATAVMSFPLVAPSASRSTTSTMDWKTPRARWAPARSTGSSRSPSH